MLVILPLKDLVDAKTRLSGVLSPSQRRALAQAMVQDVLTTLCEHPEAEAVYLVSDDPGAAMLAQHYAVQHWPELEFGTRGLNPLLDAARHRLRGRECPLLILHGDLPLLTAADIDKALVEARSADVVIGTDWHGTGTNLLLGTTEQVFALKFGVDSCARHLESTADAGLTSFVLQRLGTALDVDEPADLQRLCGQLGATDAGHSHTADFLKAQGLPERLSTMMPDAEPAGVTGSKRA